MRAQNRKLKRTLGLIMALAMVIGLAAAFAVQTSAAVGGGDAVTAVNNAVGEAVRYLPGDAAVVSGGMTIVVLIFVIVFLLLALAAVIVVIVVMNKKKNSGNPAPNSIPSPAPTNAQSFNRVQPMNQPGTQPVNQPVTQPMNGQAPLNNRPQGYGAPQPPVGSAPFPNGAPAVSGPLSADGAGETTVLGVGNEGFILRRTNGGEKISINKAEFFIGKEKAKVDYCITNNNSISRRHAKIKVRAGKCYISDLGSTNCTYINGTKLSPNQEIALIPGDKIKLSNEEFEFIG